LEKANKANIEFNKGVEAGHLRTLTATAKNSTIDSTVLAVIPKRKSATQFTLQQYALNMIKRAGPRA